MLQSLENYYGKELDHGDDSSDFGEGKSRPSGTSVNTSATSVNASRITS